MHVRHVNVARNYRGGERQTELLITELHGRGIEQSLVARRGSPLARRIVAAGIEVREVPGHLPGVLRALRGADIVHVHEGRSIYAAWLNRIFAGTPYIATRRERYWRPYHDALAAELLRIKAEHGRADLWEAHSIRGVVPVLFDGPLPDLNLGTAAGSSCSSDRQA